MHELSIAQSVLEAVTAEAVRHVGAKPAKVGLKVGELAAVDPDALRFGFDVLTHETALEGLQLEIEFCPRRHRCLDCGTEFTVKDFDFRCPGCQSTPNDCIRGDPL